MDRKKIVFLSGTRADWGKIKSLVQTIKDHAACFDYHIFVCGMHLLKSYGQTFIEIFKDGFDKVHLAKPYKSFFKMDLALSDCLRQFSSFVSAYKPDLIIIHGDRLEALAGGIVGAFNNIPVGHIEGGEISGTIDESIRHAISKLAHLHFVANNEAKNRLIQLGEDKDRIFVIGSPDIDIMLSDNLPSFESVAEHYYQIKPFCKNYALLAYHPVTTDLQNLTQHCKSIFEALQLSGQNYICIYPNNDPGSHIIIEEFQKLSSHKHFACFASIKFEAFLVLLKNANFIIGNSSAGIREAPIYGVPCIDIGSRQNGRFKAGKGETIIHCSEDTKEILKAIKKTQNLKVEKKALFGKGDSAKRFLSILSNEDFWNLELQKKFIDL